MRRKLGWLLLGAGVAGLGYWGHENNAEAIEGFVTAEAATLTQDTRHSVTTSISGRDVTLEGLVHDEAERERLLAAATQLDGFRVVHDKLNVLPKQDIYKFSAAKGENGIGEIVGFIPDEAARAALAETAPTANLDSLDLASGEPDDAWAGAAGVGLAGIGALQTGSLLIEGNNVKLEGTVDTDADYAALEAVRATGPEGYDWDFSGVSVLRPDVESYQMVARKSADGWSFKGNMPDQSAADALSGTVAQVETQNMMLAANAPEGWSTRLNKAIAAVDKLDSGRIEMIGDDISIMGQAQTEADLKAYEMALASVETGNVVENNITLLAPDEPIAKTPDFDITLDPISGLTVSGDVPAGLNSTKLAEILGVMQHSGDTTAIEGEAGDAQSEKLGKLRAIVGEFESLKISFDGENMTVVGETLFDADPVRLEEILTETVNAGDKIQISKSDRVYEEGFRRENTLTGGAELFTSGYWIPEFDASSLTFTECAERTETILVETKIRFREGSADIDSLSRRILNSLTSVIGSCLKREPQTRILIGGHTDNVGTDADNMVLSNDRAANVLSALVARGMPQTQLSARGYGETQPISDNTNDEGRAQNRRTTFEWIN